VSAIDQWIHHWAAHRGGHVALHTDDDTVTYADLSARIRAAAHWLESQAVGRGHRVAFIGLNRVEQLVLLFALARLGAILVPLNNRLSRGEHRSQIDDADPRLILATDGFATAMIDVAGDRAVVDLDETPLPRRDDDRGVPTRRRGQLPSTPTAVVGAGPGDDPVLIVYTSGTTGEPRGVVHTQGSLLYTVLNGVAHQDLGANDCVLTNLPLFHVGGLNIQTLPALYVGATVVLQQQFDPGQTLALIQRHRPTQTLQVPATMAALLAHPDLETTDLSCLVGLNSGSSVVPPSLIRAFLDRGVPVGQVYGSTETGPTALVLRYDDGAHIGSCGKAALHTEVRIVAVGPDNAGRAESGAGSVESGADAVDVELGEPGELWVRGPNVFRGYWRRPEDTARAFTNGWYRTGDIGRADPEGFVFIEDRLKDLLISGGENIYSAEVEHILAHHPAIAEVAVIGRADERWGEVPVAVVVARAPLTIEALRAWCQDRLARYKQPRDLVLVETLPRTALGKVTKHVLREQIGLRQAIAQPDANALHSER